MRPAGPSPRRAASRPLRSAPRRRRRRRTGRFTTASASSSNRAASLAEKGDGESRRLFCLLTAMVDAALARLVVVARAAVIAAAHGAPSPDASSDLPPRLREPGGAFVTLHDAVGELRGCVGTVFPDAPLVEIVRRMGAAAATRDPR